MKEEQNFQPSQQTLRGQQANKKLRLNLKDQLTSSFNTKCEIKVQKSEKELLYKNIFSLKKCLKRRQKRFKKEIVVKYYEYSGYINANGKIYTVKQFLRKFSIQRNKKKRKIQTYQNRITQQASYNSSSAQDSSKKQKFINRLKNAYEKACQNGDLNTIQLVINNYKNYINQNQYEQFGIYELTQAYKKACQLGYLQIVKYFLQRFRELFEYRYHHQFSQEEGLKITIQNGKFPIINFFLNQDDQSFLMKKQLHEQIIKQFKNEYFNNRKIHFVNFFLQIGRIISPKNDKHFFRKLLSQKDQSFFEEYFNIIRDLTKNDFKIKIKDEKQIKQKIGKIPGDLLEFFFEQLKAIAKKYAYTRSEFFTYKNILNHSRNLIQSSTFNSQWYTEQLKKFKLLGRKRKSNNYKHKFKEIIKQGQNYSNNIYHWFIIKNSYVQNLYGQNACTDLLEFLT